MRGARSAGAALAFGLAMVACSKESRPPAPAPVVTAGRADRGELSHGLPDVPGFRTDPPDRKGSAEGFVRRTYVRGEVRVEATLARLPMSAADYARWREGSAAFPPADLGVPPEVANGFYQCGEGSLSCALLIQLRSGWHLELRGTGSTSRAALDELARGLPLGAGAILAP